MLVTPRMRLIPATVAMARAEMGDRAAFAQLIEAAVPDNWPPESAADALPFFLEQLLIDPEHRVGWLAWYGVSTAIQPATLVCGAGFIGPPEDGLVETGYSVLPQFQRQGYAGEMVGAIVRWALDQPAVTRVAAETASDNTPSIRLLTRLGFQPVGDGRDPGSRRFELR